MGLNALDYSQMVLLKPFNSHRTNKQKADQCPTKDQIVIFNSVQAGQSENRTLAHLSDVTRASEIMRSGANRETQKEAQKTHYRYHDRSNENQYDCHSRDIYALGDDYPVRKELSTDLTVKV